MEICGLITEAVTIHPEAILADVIIKMDISRNNTLLVVDKKGKFLGVVEAKTLLRMLVPKFLGKDDRQLAAIIPDDILGKYINECQNDKVKDFMTIVEDCPRKSDNIMEAVYKFLDSPLTVLPVLDRWGKPLGVITRHSITRIFLSKLDITKKQ